MIDDLLDRIERKRAEYGRQLQPAATEAELAALEAAARRELGATLPAGYVAFLRRCNGLFWNGVQIYATRTGTISGSTDRFITGIVEANLSWWEYEPHRQWLFFGDGDISRYVLDRTDGSFAVIDYQSERLIRRFVTFEELLTDALHTSLGYPTEAAGWWRQACRAGRDAAGESSLAGFFQSFRPGGEHLDWVIGEAVGADEVIARLLEVYRATSPGWDPGDAYFIVREPEPLNAATAVELARGHVRAMREMARALGRSELEATLGAQFEFAVETGPPQPPGNEGLDLGVYESATDFMASVPPVESDLLVLSEAAYAIACEYFLAHHVLWPLYRQASPVEEPFRPWFELWKHGASVRFVEPGRVVAFLPPRP